jgi:hypothetical protein
MWPLSALPEQFRAIFGEPSTPTAEQRQQMADAEKQAAELEQLRAQYVAKRKAELVRKFWRDDAKVEEAYAFAAQRLSVGMRVAARNDDYAEIGRMVHARMGLYMHDQAADLAELDGFDVFPEGD